MPKEEMVKIRPDEFRPNQLVEIEVDGENSKERYHSRIEEVRESALVLAMPIRQRSIVNLRPGTSIVVNFLREWVNHAFEATILERTAEPLPLIVISRPEVAARRQRRSWVRVPVCLELRYARPPQRPDQEPDYQEAQTIDLSAGGLMFNSQQKFRHGEELKLRLNLPGGGLELRARVVRAEEASSPERRCYQVGLEFIDIRERQRDRIMRFAFEQQRKLIKKGLL
ncbi:MAG: PilZ domain-containing protein [Syntrophomonadaceae bacterium]|jgi:c-di-GMP-binding flagellar brake protein YcgR|nr:PilZ domain-containing protein [Syntrophomonadaceae bacterium]